MTKALGKKAKRDRVFHLQAALAHKAVNACTTDHAFSGRGGAGLSAFVWVTFDITLHGDKRLKHRKLCISNNSLDCGKVDALLADIPGYVSHHINLD